MERTALEAEVLDLLLRTQCAVPDDMRMSEKELRLAHADLWSLGGLDRLAAARLGTASVIVLNGCVRE